MKCTVFLKNGVEKDAFLSRGELDVCGENYTLIYETDGDECRLSFADGEVANTRRGSVFLGMRFKEGETTVCTVGEGGLSGTFTVFTKEIASLVTDDGIYLKLIYLLGGENFTLEITAGKIQEKK